MNEVGTVYIITRYIIHPTIGKIKTKRKRKNEKGNARCVFQLTMI